MTHAERIRAAARKIEDAAEYDQLDTEAVRDLWAIADELELGAVVAAPAVEPPPCRKCGGCRQIANSDEGEPWTAWSQLPPGSDLAVRLGLVKPLPCPACTAPPVPR